MPGGVSGIFLGVGYPGTYSRTDSSVIMARTLDPSSGTFTFFGDALFGYSNSTQYGHGVYRSTQALSTAFSGISHSSTTIDGLTNTATMFFGYPPQAGLLVIGSGVPAGAVVVSFTPTSLTLSAPTTSSISSTFNLVSPVVSYNGFCGIALREVLTQKPFGGTSSIGYYSPGAQVDCLERGSCSVQTQGGGSIAPWGQVYLRVGINPAMNFLAVGGFEFQPDGLFTIAIPAQWTTGHVDSAGVAELTISNRTQP